jgi:hypothetical protein
MDIFWFWLFVVLLALHNGEEYAFIDRMASLPTRRPVRIPVRRFRIALAAVTLAGAVLPALKIAGVFLADRLLAGSAAVMLANTVFPHLVATVALRRYTAGVVTAVVVITPGSILILQAALRAGLAPSEIALAALWVAVPLVAFLWLFIGTALRQD